MIIEGYWKQHLFKAFIKCTSVCKVDSQRIEVHSLNLFELQSIFWNHHKMELSWEHARTFIKWYWFFWGMEGLLVVLFIRHRPDFLRFLAASKMIGGQMSSDYAQHFQRSHHFTPNHKHKLNSQGGTYQQSFRNASPSKNLKISLPLINSVRFRAFGILFRAHVFSGNFIFWRATERSFTHRSLQTEILISQKLSVL